METDGDSGEDEDRESNQQSMEVAHSNLDKMVQVSERGLSARASGIHSSSVSLQKGSVKSLLHTHRTRKEARGPNNEVQGSKLQCPKQKEGLSE